MTKKKGINSPGSFIKNDNTKGVPPLNDPITLKVFEKTKHVAATLSWLWLHMFLGLEMTPSG